MAADLFCGAGGTSTGLYQACKELGFELELLAINHWEIAISTHTANHKNAKHKCEKVDNLNPRDIVPSGRLDILIASPECIHHSRARGGKPVSDQSRASAWHVLRWAEALYIENILIENVPEFQTWGPLDMDNMPIERLKGKTYLAFLDTLRSLGYNVEARVINAADYGDPTSRKRLFILARRDNPVKFPEPSHSKNSQKDIFSNELKPWKSAREIIDWKVKGQSIFNRKKPLSPNTMRRIIKGLQKFSNIPNGVLEPYLVMLYGGKDARSIDQPLPTITAQWQHFSLCQPYLVMNYGTNDARSINLPIPTITAQGEHIGLCEPFIFSLDHTKSPNCIFDINSPFPVITSTDAWGLANPFLVAVNHGKDDTRSYDINAPVPTITGVDALGLAVPFLIKYYGNGNPKSIDEPLDTLTTKERFGLVIPMMNGSKAVLDIHYRMLQPHELAAAMSFPSNYKFAGNRGEKVRQIGNAVPVKTAKALCKALIEA